MTPETEIQNKAWYRYAALVQKEARLPWLAQDAAHLAVRELAKARFQHTMKLGVGNAG